MLGDGFGGRNWYSSFNLSVGSYSAFTLCGVEDQLYAWGGNEKGEFGDGTLVGRTVPGPVTGAKNVKFFTAGYVSAVIKNDGTLWVWGSSVSIKAKMIDRDVRFVDAGPISVVYVKSDGTVWSYGIDAGIFGHGSKDKVPSNKPVQMVGISNAVRVSITQLATAILLENGDVYSVGFNYLGGLGRGLGFDTLLVAEKIPGLKNIVDIKSHATAFAALTKDGEVYVWGQIAGRLARDYLPTKEDNLKDIIAMSGMNDGHHFLFLDERANCFALGGNVFGQLGDGSLIHKVNPVFVASDVVEILAGETFSYIVKWDGSIWATGSSYGATGSIWMNLSNEQRLIFTKLNHREKPMELCDPTPVYQNYEQFTICEFDTIRINKKSYFNEGIYYDTIKNTNNKTIKHYKINVIPISRDTVTYLLCPGDSVMVKNIFYGNAVQINDTLFAANGCDSIILYLIDLIKPAQDTIHAEICQGDSIKLDGKYRKEGGTYQFIVHDEVTCTRLITYIVKLLPRAYSSVLLPVCEGDSVFSGTRWYADHGKYVELFKNKNGCDSTVEININYLPSHQSFNMYTICKNDSIQVGVHQYFTPGKYLDTLVNQFGCDSILETEIDTFHNLTCFKPIVWVPNAFSPNGTEPNNVFRAVTREWQQTTLTIFNRWGERIYEQTGFNPSWDGTYNGVLCESEAYFYMIRLVNKDVKPEIKNLSGTVVLIR